MKVLFVILTLFCAIQSFGQKGSTEEVRIEAQTGDATEIELALREDDCDPYSEKICPIGNHSKNVVPSLYGLPNQKGLRQAKKGKVHLGGCLWDECAPKWYCRKHKKSF
ncbi:MAG: hypothetical protein V2J65_36020 [Desulfobacteraceae bacterium]|jgi:hypothetical protein|nr:hypothetical protein [Desulfobacteraceae bacterium]